MYLWNYESCYHRVNSGLILWPPDSNSGHESSTSFLWERRVKYHFDTRDDFILQLKQKKHIVLKTRETSNEISIKK